ncbi:MAG TPA: hypothetical protein VF420_02490 [Casimicrobiaceae bacterium]
MPTARELLEQADALMRRNRAAAETRIPVLTDVVESVAVRGPATRERAGAAWSEQAAAGAAAPEKRHEEPRAEPARTIPAPVEPPVLTDAVEEHDLEALPEASERGEPSLWLGPDTIDPALHSITGPAPDTVAVVPPVTLRTHAAPDSIMPIPADERDPTITRTWRAAGSAATPPPARSMPAEPPAGTAVRSEGPPADEERWRALADQISMQVLQRIDLFTDTGLKTQLATHLQPIVARASSELVSAINDHVGKLVRSYVAEAIEREIAQWREQQR